MSDKCTSVTGFNPIAYLIPMKAYKAAMKEKQRQEAKENLERMLNENCNLNVMYKSGFGYEIPLSKAKRNKVIQLMIDLL